MGQVISLLAERLSLLGTHVYFDFFFAIRERELQNIQRDIWPKFGGSIGRARMLCKNKHANAIWHCFVCVP